jgi:hypothetical protein
LRRRRLLDRRRDILGRRDRQRDGRDRRHHVAQPGKISASDPPARRKLTKFVEPRPYANPEIPARKLLELAKVVEPMRDGRIHIEKINGAVSPNRYRCPMVVSFAPYAMPRPTSPSCRSVNVTR